MKDFRMPSLGADMEDGTLVRMAESRPVIRSHRGDIIAVVETQSRAPSRSRCFDDGVLERRGRRNLVRRSARWVQMHRVHIEEPVTPKAVASPKPEVVPLAAI